MAHRWPGRIVQEQLQKKEWKRSVCYVYQQYVNKISRVLSPIFSPASEKENTGRITDKYSLGRDKGNTRKKHH